MIILSTHPIDAHAMASIRLRYLLKFLSERNQSVILICPESETSIPPDRLPGVTIEGLPDVSKWSYVLQAAKAISRHINNSNTVVVASIPSIQALMAAVLARFFASMKFRLVLEVRDPFSLNPGLPWSALKRAIGKKMESFLLRYPDRAIFLTSAIQSMYVTGFPGQQPWKLHPAVITNGYIAVSADSKIQTKATHPFSMTYTGQFYDRRHPIEFLIALRDYFHDHPDLEVPRIQIAGQVHGEELQQKLLDICTNPLLKRCVHWMGSLPHDQTIELMQNSDVNLLITHDQGSEYAIPGKLFEYMGVQRPVLAITRDPLVKELMQRTRLGWVCEDRASITKWFQQYPTREQVFQQWAPNHEAITAYQLKNIHPRWLEFVEGKKV